MSPLEAPDERLQQAMKLVLLASVAGAAGVVLVVRLGRVDQPDSGCYHGVDPRRGDLLLDCAVNPYRRR